MYFKYITKVVEIKVNIFFMFVFVDINLNIIILNKLSIKLKKTNKYVNNLYAHGNQY